MDCTWKQRPKAPEGVICGCDQTLEWMLPWWWARYTAHNAYPVTFCDFGMSEKMRSWCRERGEVISIPVDRSWITPRKDVGFRFVEQWEKIYGKGLWAARPIWFHKPFAFLASPYEKTVWIDLDCEILTSIAPLFEVEKGHLGVVRDFLTSHLMKFDPEVFYNGGVVVFEHGNPLIEDWAHAAVTSNDLFWGDDPLLSDLINTQQFPVEELSEMWNWRISQGFNLNAKIYHWTGPAGKEYVKKHGGVQPQLEAFHRRLQGVS